MGSHLDTKPRLTPNREAYLRELAKIGIGEPQTPGARHHLLKFGWIEAVYELPDGRKMTASQFDEKFPPRTDRWGGVKFCGMTLTYEGYRHLERSGVAVGLAIGTKNR